MSQIRGGDDALITSGPPHSPLDDQFNFFALGIPLQFGGVHAGFIYGDGGDIALNLSNGLQETRKASKDTVGMAGFSLGKKGPLSIGATAKYYKFELAEEAQATGVAIDGGFILKTPYKNLNIGGSFLNFGSEVKFETESDPLPQEIRLGIKLQDKFYNSQYIFLLDGAKTNQEKIAGHIGLELNRKHFYLNKDGFTAGRVGFITEPKGIALGAGVGLGGLRIDYGVNFLDNFSAGHKFSLGYVFGLNKKAEKKKNIDLGISEYRFNWKHLI